MARNKPKSKPRDAIAVVKTPGAPLTDAQLAEARGGLAYKLEPVYVKSWSTSG